MDLICIQPFPEFCLQFPYSRTAHHAGNDLYLIIIAAHSFVCPKPAKVLIQDAVTFELNVPPGPILHQVIEVLIKILHLQINLFSGRNLPDFSCNSQQRQQFRTKKLCCHFHCTVLQGCSRGPGIPVLFRPILSQQESTHRFFHTASFSGAI